MLSRVNIAYVTQTRFPTEKAHGHQIAQVCAALASLGHAVTLFAPDIPTAVKADPRAYYAVEKDFTVRLLHMFNALQSPFVPGFLAFAVGMASYRRSLRRYFRTHAKPDLFYARSAAVAGPLLSSGVPVVLELHTLPRRGRRRFVRACNRCRLVVCLTTPMLEELRKWGVKRERMVAEGDGVTLERFARTTVHAGRPKTDRPILGYAGSLVTHDSLEKGAWQVVEAVAELKRRGSPVFGWIVGGPDAWRETYAARAKGIGLGAEDIRFDPPVPAREVAATLAAMDVCAYPAPASDHPFFRRDTSPLKLLEYFAARRPVACADIPPIRDLCDDRSVWFCAPGDGASMADAVAAILRDPGAARKRVEVAAGIANDRAWPERMRRIIAHVSRKPYT